MSTACPDLQSASMFTVAVSELSVYPVPDLTSAPSSCTCCDEMCFVCCTDFYDICDEVDCAGPRCPETKECQCAPGSVLGPDKQTCLGETDTEEGREGTDKLCSNQR